MALNLKHQTAEQFANRFWQRVLAVQTRGDQIAFHRLIWWLHNRMQAGDIASNQVRLSFNTVFERSLNSTQWNTFFTTRLIPIRNRQQAMRDEEYL